MEAIIYELDLSEFKSLKNNIHLEWFDDEIDTHIGTKNDKNYEVEGYITVDFKEFKEKMNCVFNFEEFLYYGNTKIEFKFIYNFEIEGIDFEIESYYDNDFEKNLVKFFAKN